MSALNKIEGGHIFAYQVKDPERYGVVEFDQSNRILSIEEKPKQPKSSFVVPGIYFYDNTVIQIAKGLRPSKRGELEITDINKSYLAEQRLSLTPLDQESAWLDTGTLESLMEASQYVQALQSRQGILVGSPEVAAYTSKAISLKQLLEIANKFSYTPYGEAIKKVANR